MKKSNMTFLILCAMAFPCFIVGLAKGKESEFSYYKGRPHSLIKWEELNVDSWLDYKDWLRESRRRDADPLWKVEARDAAHQEQIGRIIKCVGECRVYRGKGFSAARHRSLLLEGDEIRTLDKSFLWIFLMDGTLVRLGPQTSITLNEINIGAKENFLMVRLNQGLVFWTSREKKTYRENNLEPTDPLFNPLPVSEARISSPYRKFPEEEMEKYIKENQSNLNAVIKLNQLINENNQLMNERKTSALIVMPNGTIYGEDLHFDAFVIPGGLSFIFIRDRDSLSLLASEEEQKEEKEAEFYFRGYQNIDVKSLQAGIWYQVGEKGREIEEYPEGNKQFFFSQLLTKRITGILMVREIFLESYSQFLYEPKLSSEELVVEFGYRLWGKMDDNNSDMKRHLDFLKEYTRRIETTHLNSSQKLKKILQEKDVKGIESFSEDYYLIPWRAYLLKLSEGKGFKEKTTGFKGFDEL